MPRAISIFGVLTGSLLSACAAQNQYAKPQPPPASVLSAADTERLQGGPFALSVTPPGLRAGPSVVQAELSGTEVLGLFNVSSQYDVLQGNRQQEVGVFGRQRFAQSVQTAVPLPQGSPLQLGVSSRAEQRFTQTGILAAQSQALKARWNDGDLRFALDATGSSDRAITDCGVDASLSAPLPEPVRYWSADAQKLQVDGQLCQRMLAKGVPQKAQIVSAETGWDDRYGARSVKVSRVVLREGASLGSEQAAGPESAGYELGAQHAFELGGWSFSQGVTLRAADRADESNGWAAKSQLSHRVYRIPVTASWQRHDAVVWSQGMQQPGTETSLGFDLSAPLQQWLTQRAGANLSYHRIDPSDRKATADQQLRLGVTLGW